MKEYVEGLEQEFSAIERGFLHEQRRARFDYGSFDREQALRVAYLAYRSEAYQVRMYAAFLLGTCRRIRVFCRSSGTRSRVTPIGGSKRSWRKPSTTFALSGATRRLFLSSTSGWVTHARACAGP